MVRVKQNFPVEVDEDAGCCSTASPSVAVSVKNTSKVPKKANQPSLPKCSFHCDEPSKSILSIGSRRLTDYVDEQLGASLSSIWKYPSQYYHFCRSHYRQFLDIRKEWDSKHEPKKRRRQSKDFDETETMDEVQAAKDARKSQSTTVPHDICQICGCTFAGVYKTVNTHELAQDIDKILGCHISENWMETANICFKHFYEYQVKKRLSIKIEQERMLRETRKRAGESVQLTMGHPLLKAECVTECQPPVAGDWKRMKYAPVTVESWVKEKSNSTVSRPCCVCGVSTNLQKGFRICEPEVKKKLNERFGTDHAANGDFLFVCDIDWADYLNMETNPTQIAASPSMNYLISEISTNQHEFKEEIEEEFGDFVEEHQSNDMKETIYNQLVKDEVINVEQLIRQGQQIQQREDRESTVQYTVDGSEYVNRLNPRIPVKEEINDELD